MNLIYLFKITNDINIILKFLSIFASKMSIYEEFS